MIIEFEANNANGWRGRSMQIVLRVSYGVLMFEIENRKLRKSEWTICFCRIGIEERWFKMLET